MVAPAADQQAATAAQLDRVLAELNDLDTWFGDANRKRLRLLAEVKRRDEAVTATSAAVRRAETGIIDTKRELKTLEQRTATLVTQRQALAEKIVRQLQSAARLGSEDVFKQLLNQESPDELSRMLRYHSYISEARVAVVTEFQRTITELEATQTRLAEQQQRLEAEQREAQARRTTLVTERNERRQLIARLNEEVISNEERRTRLQADRTRLESLLEELRRQSAELDGTAFARLRGALPWPVRGQLQHRFGTQRSDAELRWQGNRFAADAGTPIKAIYEGRVIFANWLRGYGQLLIVDHGNEYWSLYGSLDGLNKGVGDWVESGEVIATAGTSGAQREPGLHFEIRKAGTPEDPNRWLGAR
ncbi:MAG: peptidoglycan DD-metalloendopeptidase family protein [Pseudomonadota bacterium]